MTQQTGNNIKVNGTLPYENADAILGLDAGNRFSVKLKNNNILSSASLPSGIIAKVSNINAEGGFNTYDKSAFETDGSLISIVNVTNKNNPLIIKVTWTTGVETTYMYDFTSVTLASE